MNSNPKIAAAVAAVLGIGAGGAALAAPPSLASAQTPFAAYYISGSSAAKAGILGALENDMCGGAANSLIFSSTGDTNFFAVSCAPSSTTGISNANGTNVFTVYYRDEGGSVTGALPLFSGSPIAQLNLAGASCASNLCTVAVGGSSANNGLTDSFTGVTSHVSNLGVTDVEPGALIGDNYPSGYSTTAYGKASASQLGGLTTFAAFQQVFGIFVNGTGLHTPICLGSDAVKAILAGSATDWNKVEDCATHAAVASASTPIILVNREPGSGSRTATSIYWLNDECNPAVAGVPETGAADFFSTGNVLGAANTTTGGITYASIDNNFPPQSTVTTHMVLASIDNVFPSNLAAAQGQYGFWVESFLVQPNATQSAQNQSIQTFLVGDLQNANTAPHTQQINLIPDNGTNSTPALPASSTANNCTSLACTVKTAPTIYTNPFTRGGITCNVPQNFLF
jgi:hypothetical protein